MRKSTWVVSAVALLWASFVGALDTTECRQATYGTPTHWCDLAQVGTGSGTSGSPWNASQCITQPVAGNIVCILPGVSVAIDHPTDVHTPAWNPTNSGSNNSTGRIIYVTKFPAIGLSSVESNANRTEFRHNGSAPTISGGAGGAGDTGGAMLGGNGKSYILYDGFYIDMAQAYIREDSGVLRTDATTGIEFRNFVIKGTSTTCASNCVMWRPERDQDTVLYNFSAYSFVNDGTGSAVPQPGIFTDTYGAQNMLIERFNIYSMGIGFYIKGGPDPGTGPVYNSGEVRYGTVRDVSDGCMEVNATDAVLTMTLHHILCYNWGYYGVQIGLINETRNMIFHHLTIVGGTGCSDSNCQGPIYMKGTATLGTGNVVRDNILVWPTQAFNAGYNADEESESLSGFTINYNGYRNTGGSERWKYNGSSYTTIASWRSAVSQEANSVVLATDPFTNSAGNDYTVAIGHAAKTASSTGGELGAYEGGASLLPDTGSGGGGGSSTSYPRFRRFRPGD